MEAQIYPYQFNDIKMHLRQLLQTVYFAGDYRVYNAMKDAVTEQIRAYFPSLPDDHPWFAAIPLIRGQKELHEWLDGVEPSVIPFPSVSERDIAKLFPKVKKLELPDLAALDRRKLTYLGWRDIATRSLFFVYPLHGELVGVQASYVAGSRSLSSVCTLCGSAGKGTEIGLVAAVTRSSSYKSVGNHMCLNSENCNAAIRSTEGLETFLTKALSRK